MRVLEKIKIDGTGKCQQQIIKLQFITNSNNTIINNNNIKKTIHNINLTLDL